MSTATPGCTTPTWPPSTRRTARARAWPTTSGTSTTITTASSTPPTTTSSSAATARNCREPRRSRRRGRGLRLAEPALAVADFDGQVGVRGVLPRQAGTEVKGLLMVAHSLVPVAEFAVQDAQVLMGSRPRTLQPQVGPGGAGQALAHGERLL